MRVVRSFARQRLSTVRTAIGTPGGSALQSGSSREIETMVSVMSSPPNAHFPVSISHKTHPKAHTSQRLSAGRPFACSGDIYAAVPRMTPTPVIMAGEVIVGELARSEDDAAVGSIALAKPKSRTL